MTSMDEIACAGSTDSIDEFARIYPKGLEAEEALSLVFDDENLSLHHRFFIHVERRKQSEDSESETGMTDRHSHVDPQYWAGYYSLSLQDPVVNKSAAGWRLGKGYSSGSALAASAQDKGVDLLLICPGKSNRHVAPVHARIRFHPLSGAIMLFGVQEGKPVSYEVHDEYKPRILAHGQGHVLYQARNLFTVGKLSYILVFNEFNDEQYSSFVQKRNALIYGSDAMIPHLHLSAVPRHSNLKRGLVITYGTIGHGAYGRVLPAVHAHTGDPLAVKHQQPINKHQMDSIVREADLGTRFKVWTALEYFVHMLTIVQESQGLLPTLKIWCEHSFEEPCYKVPQSVFSSFPLANRDFSQVGWSWRLHTAEQVLECFRGPLRGLSVLHANGFMHRDVTAKNLLMMSFDPPRAVLGDFGKAIRADTSKDIHIGPAHSRAPEVDGKTAYTNKIDVWSLGYAWMNALFPKDLQPRGAPPLSVGSWHREAMKILREPNENGGFEDHLAQLLCGMIAWMPARRSSAAQALHSPCFSSEFSISKPSVSQSHILAPIQKPSAGDVTGSSGPPSLSQRASHFASGSDRGPFNDQKQLQSNPAENNKKAKLY